MIKVLIDTNIIIDFFSEREPFYKDAEIVFQEINGKQISGYISASAVTDIFYLLRKAKGNLYAVNCILKLIQIIEILSIDKQIIVDALFLNWVDFEDAVQAQTAIENEIDIIITRNTKDFQETMSVKVLNPIEFIEWIKK